jgi:transcriptional regulator with XRE-family HTH domain
MKVSIDGELLKGLRENAHMTQLKLAYESGVDPATIRYHENNSGREAHISTVHKLAKALAVDPTELIVTRASA